MSLIPPLIASFAWLAPAAAAALTPAGPAEPGAKARAQAPDPQPALPWTAAEKRLIARHSPLGPPPADPTNAYADNPAAAQLGQFLFFETRLSSNGAVSCATCHDPQRHFADARPLGEGLTRGTRHTQALWNVAYNRWFFWDGRAGALWAQALVPIERPDEMGGSRVQTARLIAADPALSAAYERVFGPLPAGASLRQLPERGRPLADDPNDAQHRAWEALGAEQRAGVNRVFVNVGKAIAAYERKLISRRAPFDRFAEGLAQDDPDKIAALSPAAQRGLRLFLGRGNCRLCHSGPNFTDGEFHSVRVADLDLPTPRDPGRYAGIPALAASEFNAASPYSDARDGQAARLLRVLERRPSDWGLFKTPSLRNVAVTPPYMHQGQFATLERVIEHYSTFEGALPAGHHDVDRTLEPLRFTPGEAADLRAFLESLTDTDIAPELLRPPPSPLIDAGGTSSPR